ncbi:MAG: 4-hydroxy-tetrahydrodipicolinate synthase [Acidimicrobiales bacterium]
MAPRDQAPRFGTLVTAMVTPFDAAGAMDPDAAATLARWLVDHGSEGLVVGGTTGESPVLDDKERLDLWRAVAGAVTVPVVVGAGTNDTRHSVELAAAAADAGAAAVLVVTPYYSRPSQEGLLGHFTAVAAATGLPVLLYDIPVRTGRRIHPETVLRLLEAAPNVVGVKDSTSDPAGSARLMARAPDWFEVYCGDDALGLPLLALGAAGLVSVASHWAGREQAAMVAAFRKGDVEGARHANARLVESYAFESTELFPNPLPAKAACRAQGLAVGQCRPPMGAAPPELDGEARLILNRLSGEPIA